MVTRIQRGFTLIELVLVIADKFGRGRPAALRSAARLCSAGAGPPPPLARLRRLRSAMGFTLIELVLVIAIIGILLGLAVPQYRSTIRASQEAVLRDDLFQMRSLIDQYTLDKQQAPQSLQDLVTAGYLRQIPKDPFTNSSDSWQTSSDDTMMSPDQTLSGITDVHSGATGAGLDGTAYSTW